MTGGADARPARTLLRGLSHIATFDDDASELRDADILIEDGVISAVGAALGADGVDRVIDGRGLLALPGLINAHQHLYQGSLRAIRELETAPMGRWLAGIGRRSLDRWQAGLLSPETVRAISSAVLLESLLGGTTTVADQHYFFPGGEASTYVEATIEAARYVGVRLHAARGTITLGRSRGGTADDELVEPIDAVLAHCASLIDRFHDPRPLARTRVALAPCGFHVDQPAVFTELGALAADHDGVRLHTHLYEKVDAEACARMYGVTPWRMLERVGWASDRTWLAHVVDPPAEEIPELAAARVGVAHLVAPDLKLGWGLAPLREYLGAGVVVGFGTTGSASNDGANMLGDLRLAALAHRPAIEDPTRWPTARELLRAATRGSAECLGRDDLGVIATGYAADIACWDLETVDRVGVDDPVAGLLFTGLSDAASLVVVGGEVLVEGGRPSRLDPAAVASAARRAITSGP
jgi:cytosine/adenosine deaminase-related metal-dependent hydrolase